LIDQDFQAYKEEERQKTWEEWEQCTGRPRPAMFCDTPPPSCEAPGKHPRVAWTEKATCDPEQIRRWHEQCPWFNWAIHLGKSGLYVVEVDNDPDGSGLAALAMAHRNKSVTVGVDRAFVIL
jgi:hypothetical protein